MEKLMHSGQATFTGTWRSDDCDGAGFV